jgi:hypothetical protein
MDGMEASVMIHEAGSVSRLPAEQAEQRAPNRRLEQQTASRNTQVEFGDLLQAMHRLEAALGSPAPFREQQWATRAGRELEEVRHALEAHILSAEAAGGLFDELNLATPRVAERVDSLRREHGELMERLSRLERGLEPSPQPADFSSLRREADALLTALRRHHALEVDLIFECFWTDIGVGD